MLFLLRAFLNGADCSSSDLDSELACLALLEEFEVKLCRKRLMPLTESGRCAGRDSAAALLWSAPLISFSVIEAVFVLAIALSSLEM